MGRKNSLKEKTHLNDKFYKVTAAIWYIYIFTENYICAYWHTHKAFG